MPFVHAIISRYRLNLSGWIRPFRSFKQILPVILQADPVECGLTCLAMIFSYYGTGVSMASLRHRCVIGLSGLSIGSLLQVARDFGMDAKVYRLEISALATVQLPAVLHWNFDHYVVLKEIRKNSYFVHDPARGLVRLKKSQFSRSFTGMILEFFPKDISPATNSCRLGWLKNVRHYVSSHYALLGKIFILSISCQLFLLTIPIFVRFGMDNFLALNMQIGLFILIALGYVGLQFLGILSKWLKTHCLLKLEALINEQLAQNVMQQLLGLPFQYFEQRRLADIIHRFQSIDQIRQILSTGLGDIWWSGLFAFLLVIYLLFLIFPFGLLTVLFAISYSIIRYSLAQKQKIKTTDCLQARNHEQACLIETIRAIQPIKIFSKECDRLQMWVERYRRFLRSSYEVSFFKNIADHVKVFLLGVELILLVVFAVIFQKQLSLSFGMFYAYLFCRQLFYEAYTGLIDRWHEIQMLPLHIDRLDDLLRNSTCPTSISTDVLVCPPVIQVQQLNYRHSKQEPWLFRALNMTIHSGEMVVLVGPSGCGKSTLLKILMGLVELEEGQVLVNGVALREYAYTSLRLASVMQNDILLAGTIAENICFFSNHPDFKQIEKCARLAAIWEDIERFPLKLNSQVGDMGITLSGGQRQRILLARALYSNPLILFLDEVTSHLDEQNERSVISSIKELGITCMMVAHRPTAIAMADRTIDLRPFVAPT